MLLAVQLGVTESDVISVSALQPTVGFKVGTQQGTL
jgi:hypothetical protein